MKKIILSLLLFSFLFSRSQSLYFPPLTGTVWDTTAPATLGWCQPKIDSLYAYLDAKHTKSFILLKDGKIVLEKYFGTFNRDSIHYWASAGKSLASMLTGIAAENGAFSIQDTVSDILGNGWTSATITQERKIRIRDLLTMTSGLDDTPPAPCDNESDTASCLLYLADPNTRWAYHTGAYQRTHDIIQTATGTNFNIYTRNAIGLKIGMNGIWLNGVYYSKTRDAARFGLLTLAKCIWNGDTVMHDMTYYHDMSNTSQPFNLSYGYLWWLNGKASYMAPGIPIVFTDSFMPNAPADMFAALGKNDQKIYIAPSLNMVVVRFGDSADGVASAFSPFDNDLWGKINDLSCAVGVEEINKPKIVVSPNPIHDRISIINAKGDEYYSLTSIDGSIIFSGTHIEDQDFSNLSAGYYQLCVKENEQMQVLKLIKY